MVVRDLDLVMGGCLSERDERVEAARQEECEAKRALDYLVNRHEAEAGQRLVNHLKLMEELTSWRVNVCGLAREMGTPLKMILGRAESLLKSSEQPVVQTALQYIVKQVERLIQLRQPLCRLDQEFGHNASPADQPAASEGNSASDQRYVGDWNRKPR